MLPERKKVTIEVAELGELEIYAMSAKCYVEFQDAREAGKSELETAAIVAKYSVPGWLEHSVEEILCSVDARALIDILLAVTNMLGVEDSKKKSEPALLVNSS